MTTKTFTEILITELKHALPSLTVVAPWDAAKNSTDDFNREYYVPKVDVVVGPFNTDKNIQFNNEKFDQLIIQESSFIEWLYENSHLGENKEYIDYRDFLTVLNINPRCFIAFEIENTGGTKHSMGDMFNASIMGKIGVVIPMSEEKYEMFVRLKKYIHFAQQVGKLEGDLRNVLIIKWSKFLNE